MAHRRRARRAGLWTLVCLLGTTLAALAIARFSHLGVAATLVQFLVGGGTLASLYLAWATYQAAHVSGEAVPSTEQIADELATAVRDQWSAESSAWRIADPHPLPVSWVPADASLVESWDQLETLANSGGWAARSTAWASGPDDLTGEGNELANILARVPTGRLVILGEAGAGKTVLMVRLILELLQRRAPRDPVPVLLSLASWKPKKDEGFRQWIANTLSGDYPAYAAPAMSGGGGRTRIEALVNEGRILPILDGLDEIPDALRALAIVAINDAIKPGERFVLTSRTSAYKHAVRPKPGSEITLRGAAAVQLCPLGTEAVAKYLRTDAGGRNGAAARWDSVVAALGAGGPIAVVLSNPLMVGLARLLYNPRPGEYTVILPDPTHLCGFTDAGTLKDHLFDGFVPAAYRARPGRSLSAAAQAAHWLAFLAHHLEDTVQVPNFAWWYLGEDPSARTVAKVLGGVVYGLRIGTLLAGIGAAITAVVLALRHLHLRWHLAWPAFVNVTASWHMTTIGKWLLTGFAWYVVGGYLAHVFGERLGRLSRMGQPSYGTRWNLKLRVPISITAGLAVGLLLWLVGGPRLGLGYGIGIGLLVALIGLERLPSDLVAASPKTLLTRDRLATLTTWPPIVLMIGLSAGIVSGLTGALVDLRPGLGHGLVAAVTAALGAMLWAAPVSSVNEPSWPNWLLARNWLALRGGLPWRLMNFLAEAHGLGVLRQAGPIYQFRHIELQRRLASRGRP